MTECFVSYKQEDEARVRRVVEGLRKAGLSVWWDRDIPGGGRWRETIVEHLDAARCVVVCWTQASTGPGSAWVQRAAYAHSVYVPEVRHPVEVKAQEEHLARWLTKRLEMPVKLFDLRAQGFELVGGRLLPDSTGAVAAQFMFERSQGTRLTLFVRRDAQGNDTAFRFAQDGGLSTFYWVDRGYGYALSGDQSREFMLTLADSVYRQLNP